MVRGAWWVAVLLALGVSARAADAPTPPASGPAVVLADGRILPTRTKPLMAFGSVNFVDANGKSTTLPASDVNVSATRALPGNQVATSASRGTLNYAEVVRDQPGLPAPTRTTVSPRIYATTWCPVCKQAIAWLDQRHVHYDLTEVDLLPRAAQAAADREIGRLAGGKVAYPTIVVGNQVSQGFDAAWLTQVLGLNRTPTVRTAARPTR